MNVGDLIVANERFGLIDKGDKGKILSIYPKNYMVEWWSESGGFNYLFFIDKDKVKLLKGGD